jgi:hypothetical protein
MRYLDVWQKCCRNWNFSKLALKVPRAYLFTTPSDSMLASGSGDLASSLADAPKMFPSQRHAVFEKLSKVSFIFFLRRSVQGDQMFM